jgi:hypothetical protein
MESQIFKDEVLAGAESADHPAEEMPERRDHSRNHISEKSESSFAPSHSLCRCAGFWRGTARLRKRGFSVEVQKSSDGENWTVTATKSPPTSGEQMNELRDELEAFGVTVRR